MKNVLHLLPMNKLSGAEKMTLLICKNLNDYEPIVMTGGADLAEFFIKNNIESYYVKFSFNNIHNIIKELNQVIISHGVSIVHAHDNFASMCAYLTKKRYCLDIKLISHIHNCYPWLKKNTALKKMDQFLRPKYDFNITCGRLVYDFYNKYAAYFEPHKTTILSNAMDIKEVTNVNQEKVELVQKKYDIPTDQIVFGFIGRLSEQKGLIPFIKELANYKNQFINCKFLLVGNGDQEEEIKKLIKEYNMEQLFILTGFQKDVYSFYPLIDIFFLPSLYEGLPMVLLEAIAFKCPIVSMNVGSIIEILKDDNGILVNSGDQKMFILKLLEIKDNRAMQKSISERAYKYLSKNYDISNYIVDLEKIYSSEMSN